jgi:hypothetical protein
VNPSVGLLGGRTIQPVRRTQESIEIIFDYDGATPHLGGSPTSKVEGISHVNEQTTVYLVVLMTSLLVDFGRVIPFGVVLITNPIQKLVMVGVGVGHRGVKV